MRPEFCLEEFDISSNVCACNPNTSGTLTCLVSGNGESVYSSNVNEITYDGSEYYVWHDTEAGSANGDDDWISVIETLLENGTISCNGYGCYYDSTGSTTVAFGDGGGSNGGNGSGSGSGQSQASHWHIAVYDSGAFGS